MKTWKNRKNRGSVRAKLRVFPHRVSFQDDFYRVLRQISIKLMGPGEGQNRGTPIRTQVETREYLIFENMEKS